MEKKMGEPRELDQAFDEGTTFAHSNRIFALIDDDVEVESDEEIEAILISEGF